MFRFSRTFFITLAVLLLASVALAQDLKLPLVFTDHMVLQHGQKAPIWGWATPGSEVTIQFQGQTLTVTTNANGKWESALAALNISAEPAELTVGSGDQTLTVKDVLVGDVWLCSGQSNMAWAVTRSKNAKIEIANADHPLIRHFSVTKNPQMFEQEKFKAARWTVCSPKVVGGYTAVGYFFGRHLQQKLQIPIGLLSSSWGGTRIEPWTPRIGFKKVVQTKGIYNAMVLKDPASVSYKQTASGYLKSTAQWLDQSKQAVANQQPINEPVAFPEQIKPYTSHQSPAMLYNGMLAPMVPFAIKGAIWYQGEASRHDGMLYLHKTRALVEGWRDVWGIKDLPYYFVQIAPYHYGKESGHVLAKFWEAQAQIEKQIPHTGMVVVSDIGNLKDIHPKNKQDVGKRLANMALVKTYGKTGIVYHGPVFKEMKTEEDQLILTFDHVGSGLASRDGKPLTTFEIGSPESQWTPANATIEGTNKLVVSAQGVTAPCIVRFAYDKLATPNLMNKEGLPAQTFLAGEQPVWDPMFINVEESTGYELVYEKDLAKLGKKAAYEIDHSSSLLGKFDRIAYYMELTDKAGKTKWVYISMDAFTDNVKKIGIPTLASKASFQQKVKNLNVFTSEKGLATGLGIDGNIEFWPNNYAPNNGAKIPGASGKKYDFGDQKGGLLDGYGSMQIHLTAQKQTAFAINSWKTGNNADLGIGNSQTGPQPDWTFSKSGSHYPKKRLRVLVRMVK